MSSSFLAYITRMKYINRWGLMRSTQSENDMEHSMQVVFLAHALAALANARYGAGVDEGRVALLAAYHDISEVLTGDLATPVKYSNIDIQQAFHAIESTAVSTLADMLPADMRGAYEQYLKPDEQSREWRIVKAADKLSAYIKCLEELKSGNTEFLSARQSIEKQLQAIDLPELQDFMIEFGDSFNRTLDELSKSGN